MPKQSLDEVLRILALHTGDTEDTPPPPVDPHTVDVGEMRPVTLQDVLAVEAIRMTDDADTLHKMTRIAHLVQLRTGLNSDRLVSMSFEDYNIMVSRIVADVLPKIKKENTRIAAYNLFRAERGEGGAH